MEATSLLTSPRNARGETRAEELLRMVRDNRDYANEIEAAAMARTIDWLRAVCAPTPADQPAGWLTSEPVGGEGTPPVPEEAVAEFAAFQSMSDLSARVYLADAWNLAWRLPETWNAARTGTLLLWRARQISSLTHGLSPEAAAYVDHHVAPIAHKVGPARLRRIVQAAEALFDPLAAQAHAESRHVDMYPSGSTTDLAATLDPLDAHDLEAAVAMVAAELGKGSEDSLDVRRAKALGVMARRQLGGAHDPLAEVRIVHTYVHIDPSHPLARVERGGALVPVAQIREWCEASQTKVIVRPVLDLAAHHERDGYVPSAEMREQAIVRDVTCVHPYCHRPARSSDLDHIEPYPDGPTATENLAPLCRRHHRLKTHAGWSYTRLEPGYYLWRSPAGRRYLRAPSGTVNLESAKTDVVAVVNHVV